MEEKIINCAKAGLLHEVEADKSLSEIVALAAILSAGEGTDIQEKEKNPPQQMLTIFDSISLNNNIKTSEKHFLPLTHLSLNEKAIFPESIKSKNTQGNNYETIRENLEKIVKQSSTDPETYLETLLEGMRCWTWSVPSAYYHSDPDVSLYDHSRMTAALAVCLSDFPGEKISVLLKAVTNDFYNKASNGDLKQLDTEIALLVGGDISGIQNFIYTLTSKGAAKTLRGRSFYLQLLTEAILRYVLHELQLPSTNVIYSGGGHFYLFAPISAKDKLKDIQQNITRKLLIHHQTNLYLALGYSSVPASGFKIGRFPEYWGKMHASLSHAKKHRYSELGNQFYTSIFEPPEIGGNPEKICSACGEDHPKVKLWDIEKGQEEQLYICPLCESFAEDIGKNLPKSSMVALGLDQPCDTQRGTAIDALKAFGMQVQFLSNKNEKINLPGAQKIIIWHLDDFQDQPSLDTDNLPITHLLRYTVNHIPLDKNGEPLSFDELQNKVKGGFEKLGVLRMDVDNLGEIFKKGLGKKATVARLSTLSFQISLFFEGWIKHICESGDFYEYVYSVYSGGDDIFLVGPWDRMPDLAMKIKNDFSKYTGYHPQITLSGGLSFIGGKYPIYQAADDAKDALDVAKDLEGKDGFYFLDHAWKWNVFISVNEKRLRLRPLVAPKELDKGSLEGPQAILQILQKLANEESNKGIRPVWGRWIWMGAYLLYRMAEQWEKGKPELASKINEIRNELHQNNYSNINQWGAAARWVQLEIRKKSKNE